MSKYEYGVCDVDFKDLMVTTTDTAKTELAPIITKIQNAKGKDIHVRNCKIYGTTTYKIPDGVYPIDYDNVSNAIVFAPYVANIGLVQVKITTSPVSKWVYRVVVAPTTNETKKATK